MKVKVPIVSIIATFTYNDAIVSFLTTSLKCFLIVTSVRPSTPGAARTFSLTVNHIQQISLRVRGCRSAVILLSARNQLVGSEVYRLEIGAENNTALTLHRGWESMFVFIACITLMILPIAPVLLLSQPRRRQLQCDRWAPIWISWNNGLIRYGRGHTAGKLQLLSFQDPNPFPIMMMSLDANATGSVLWEFGLQDGIDALI